jgi:hypothetical protein
MFRQRNSVCTQNTFKRKFLTKNWHERWKRNSKKKILYILTVYIYFPENWWKNWIDFVWKWKLCLWNRRESTEEYQKMFYQLLWKYKLDVSATEMMWRQNSEIIFSSIFFKNPWTIIESLIHNKTGKRNVSNHRLTFCLVHFSLDSRIYQKFDSPYWNVYILWRGRSNY